MNNLRTIGCLFAIMVLLTGVIYPIFITLIGYLAFPYQAGGSLIEKEGTIIGSSLIAQKFTDSKYFWPRPSAIDYYPLPSGGSNLAQTSPKLKEAVEKRAAALDKNAKLGDLPVDMLYASGSGIDPHISIESAYFQVKRVAEARHWDENQIQKVQQYIDEYAHTRGLEERHRFVNVLQLNLALDKIVE